MFGLKRISLCQNSSSSEDWGQRSDATTTLSISWKPCFLSGMSSRIEPFRSWILGRSKFSDRSSSVSVSCESCFSFEVSAGTVLERSLPGLVSPFCLASSPFRWGRSETDLSLGLDLGSLFILSVCFCFIWSGSESSVGVGLVVGTFAGCASDTWADFFPGSSTNSLGLVASPPSASSGSTAVSVSFCGVSVFMSGLVVSWSLEDLVLGFVWSLVLSSSPF